MRDLATWNDRFLKRQLKIFSTRLQRDLLEYPAKDLPGYGSYYIWGKSGTGKTTMAAHMYLEAAKKFYLEMLPGKCLFTTEYAFLNQLKSCIGDSWADERAVMATYTTAEFLVLDDLGAEKITEWGLSQLQILINERYEEMLTTVITSNVSLKKLADVLGDDRIPSRIERMCDGILHAE